MRTRRNARIAHPHARPALATVMWLLPAGVAMAGSPLDLVREVEQRRIELVRRVAPAVVCVFTEGHRGGGSGVLINEDGYGLTNYHVIAAMLDTRRGWGGLGDGVRYELEVLGIDVTGDVAMFRLIPPKDPFRFPYAPLGDSDAVELGDPVLAMGNPFSLSDDYSPTVTRGIITGTHRYQHGVRGNLVYTDCLQTDAAINPGNSGGPLFNAAGEVIGINGRISVNTRGRFNVGFGYAISSNQIKRFMPSLRAGLLARHGGWGATVTTGPQGVTIDAIKPEGPVERAGLRFGDEIVALDDTPVESANQVQSILGTYPSPWPVRVTYRRDGKTKTVVVRLDPIDPVMKTGFQIDVDINRREAKRVLQAHRAFSLGSADADGLKRLAWKIERRFDDPADEPQSYTAAWTDDGAIRMTRRYEDAHGRVIEFDQHRAVQRASTDAHAFDVTPTEAMALAATHILLRKLPGSFDALPFDRIGHAGGDGLIPEPEDAVLAEADGRVPTRTRTLEVIGWQIREGVVARLGFDAATKALLRIEIEDRTTDATATVRIRKYERIGDIRLPAILDVQAAGTEYRDRLSAWEVSP